VANVMYRARWLRLVLVRRFGGRKRERKARRVTLRWMALMNDESSLQGPYIRIDRQLIRSKHMCDHLDIPQELAGLRMSFDLYIVE
jgi:hypothetical protein